MLAEPKCFKRRCINFIGVKNTKALSKKRSTVDGVILSCKAFPNGKGIPFEIAYGKNLHLKPFKGDKGVRFEKAKSDEAFANG